MKSINQLILTMTRPVMKTSLAMAIGLSLSLSLGGSLITGCTTPKAADQGPLGVFSVRVVPYFGPDVKIYVTAYNEGPVGKIGERVAIHRVGGNGVAGFVEPIGSTYRVEAFADQDGNGKLSPGEPTASLSGVKPLSYKGSGPEYDPKILTLPGAGVPQVPVTTPASAQNSSVTLPDGTAITNDDIEALNKKLKQENLPQIPSDVDVSKLPLPPPPK